MFDPSRDIPDEGGGSATGTSKVQTNLFVSDIGQTGSNLLQKIVSEHVFEPLNICS